MACDICDPPGASDQDDQEEHDREHCDHEHDHEHGPERPDGIPDCDVEPTPGEGCIPNEEILRRERELAEAQAKEARLKQDIENREKALQDLKQKSDALEQALETYDQQAEQREQRHKACQEFVDCKEPDVDTHDRKCVDDTVREYRKALERYEVYLPYLSRKVGYARIRTAHAERRHKRAEEHYESVSALATECLAKCEELRSKYEEAAAKDDRCLMYLYWRSMRELLEQASEDCLDRDSYIDHLCKAFERLCEAKDKLNEAQAKQDELERDLELMIERYEAWKKDKWALITAHIAKCCCRPTSDAKQSPSPAQTSVTQTYG